ncbi:ADOP family duplicated permease [Opitutus terrae]|uniref:Permease n=1 Tax=Opitutus terrae (strain DSM 11246 / JCM 15787 / PB90-1) TaxID=452637 RepID=B1ZXW7_OPITP|nr:ADOP family duplicated permease [Opitutus terrae]ACB75169.1 permease [Opitutus terrae PB90-1]
MIGDLKFTVRQLAKSPGFTATALLTLALALGANSAVFSLVHTALLRPARPEESGKIVSVFNARQGAERDFRRFSLAEYEVLRTSRGVFSDVAALAKAQAGLSAHRGEAMNRSLVHLTTANFFSLFGTEPAQGRFFNAEESRPNAGLPVAVASHAAWQRLGGRPDFVGSTLWVNGQACTVIGVTREDFKGGGVLIAPDLWLPLGMFPRINSAFSRIGGQPDLTARDNHSLLVVARLLPGESLDAIAPRLPALAQQISDLQPAGSVGARELLVAPAGRLGITSEPEAEEALALLAAPLVLMAACVLLIASLNLANMLLARGAARAKEIALRLALGSGRRRIVQQLMIEGLVLAFAGGALGLFISDWANRALIASLTGALQGIATVTVTLKPELDSTVLSFTFAACVVATLLFSLAPALRASRLDVVSDLKSVGAAAGPSERWNRFFAGRHLLVMAQIALSLVLLFSASLFLRGALKAGDIPLGFKAQDRLLTEFDFSLRNAAPADAQRSLAAVLERVGALPGVARAAFSTQAPMNNREISRRVQTAGTPADASPGPQALFTGITPGYFDALGVPVLRGRDFSELESRDAGAPRVAIIDASLAQRLFPGEDALGQRVSMAASAAGGAATDLEIVGVVGEHRHEFLQVEPTLRIFVPLVHGYTGTAYLHTRLEATGPAALAAALGAVRAELQRLDPNLPMLRHEPFADFIDRDASLWSARLGAAVFGLFGAVALLLSVMGVYSVKAYAVARRTREIGIRSALGAGPRDIFALVMKQGARQIAVACGAGIVLSLLVGRTLSSLLFHISPADPIALIGAMAVLAGSALLASYIPARDAVKVDPIEALRAE